jgi:hypothetical protein
MNKQRTREMNNRDIIKERCELTMFYCFNTRNVIGYQSKQHYKCPLPTTIMHTIKKNIRKNRIQQYVSEIYHNYTVMYTKENVIDFTK